MGVVGEEIRRQTGVAVGLGAAVSHETPRGVVRSGSYRSKGSRKNVTGSRGGERGGPAWGPAVGAAEPLGGPPQVQRRRGSLCSLSPLLACGKGGTLGSPAQSSREEAVLITTLEDGGSPRSACARPGSRVEGQGSASPLTTFAVLQPEDAPRRGVAVPGPPGGQRMVPEACQDILRLQAQGGLSFPSLSLIWGWSK